MKRFFLLTGGILLVVASMSTADVAPPPGIVEVTPRVRLVGMDKYPDHVFYLTFKTGRGNPKAGTLLRFEVKNADPVTLKGSQRRIADMYVLAIERKDFEKRKAADDTLAWLTEKADGVLSASVTAPPTFGKAKDKEVPVTEYTVSIADGKLTATMKAADKAKSTSAVSADGPLPPWVIGVACVLSLGLFGVWFARRRL